MKNYFHFEEFLTFIRWVDIINTLLTVQVRISVSPMHYTLNPEISQYIITYNGTKKVAFGEIITFINKCTFPLARACQFNSGQ